MKTIPDIDSLFDKYISDYVYKNLGKSTPEEIENEISLLYSQFGNKKLKELDNKSPVEYFAQFNASELLEMLENSVQNKISVSDFLFEALLTCENGEKVIIEKLEDELPEEVMVYLLNAISFLKSEKADSKCLEIICWDYSESLKELATEILITHADSVKEKILQSITDCENNSKIYLAEILSYCSKDDRVFTVLINEFLVNLDKIPIYCSYVSRYGDERAIDFLLTLAENEKVGYADFKEIRFAIESLGGECNVKRDFTKKSTNKKQ